MQRNASATTSKLRALVREPTLHFFLIAAVLLASQKLLADDPRTIELTPALKTDLLRRYRDQLNRAPTRAEAEAFLSSWKAEEALYREALREGIDREDATVRSVLIGKMRERAMLHVRVPEPTEADLRDYLERHRSEFEAPLLYEYEFVVFSKDAPLARETREKAARQLSSGATPVSLGLRSTVANVNRARIEREFGPEVANTIAGLAPSEWRELEAFDRLLLVRMIRIQGGLPEPRELNARLTAAWKGARQRQAMDDATRAIADRYQLREESQ
jgi:hypothetical protein